MTMKRTVAPVIINRVNTQPSYDVYASVEKTDLGSVAKALEELTAEYKTQLKPGNVVSIRGQVESMESAFSRLGLGIVFAALLVYLLMVVNFQSFRYPFIIITALPGALCGMVWMLFLTGTTFSIPSLMGAIMSVGVATANSILLVSFAKDHLPEVGGNAYEAALGSRPNASAPYSDDGHCHDYWHACLCRWAWAKAANRTRHWVAPSLAVCYWLPLQHSYLFPSYLAIWPGNPRPILNHQLLSNEPDLSHRFAADWAKAGKPA